MTREHGVVVRDCHGALDTVATVELTIRAVGVSPVFEVPPANAALAQKLGLDRWFVVHLPLGTDVTTLAKRISTCASTAIDRAEADVIGGIASESSAPSDANFAQQWALENTGQTVAGVVGTPDADINARGAWHISTGSPTTIVAILDGGVNPHEQFADRMLPGINVPAGTTDTTDFCSNHGTMTAGVIAAAGNDAVGIAGIDWNTRILPVVVLNGCSGVTSWLAQGLTWATDHGANVVNCSLQYSSSTSVMEIAVQYANQSGVAIVAASGNTADAGVTYPAKYPEVIAVGSLNAADEISSTSAIGEGVDVEAPGVNVLSTSGLNEYALSSGTSIAAPHATATIALMHAAAPHIPCTQLRVFLESTCHDVGKPGPDGISGMGRIDAGAAIRLARAGSLGDLDGDGMVGGSDVAVLLGAWGACDFDCRADLDDDGAVGGGDLALLLSTWGIVM
ncbi:MAG: S8 family serine peptidase [Planctomycetota bacterium]|nr:S8 family serine peptidase [Planctomycetota bacterium]